MSSRLRSTCRTSACAGLMLLASAVGPTGAFAAAPPRHAGDAGRTVAEVAAYWTPQRMERARPLELLSSPNASTPRVGAPSGTSSSTVAFSSFELMDTLSFPDRVHGKVFFTRPGVGNFVCSGTVVDALNRATVITAGHCVRDGGTWSTNFAFAPGYRNLGGIGNAPYGLWAASDEAAPQPWVDSANLKFDVGAAVLARDVSGRTLENVVGGRGIAFNQPTSQPFRSHGYPVEATAQHRFDGTTLWACDSGSPILDSPTSASGPSTMGIGCDMTGGSSGGGWVTGNSGSGYLNGVNSYRYSNQPDLMYGPYFGSTIKALYDFAAAEPPGAPGSNAAGNSVPGSSDATSAPPPPSCRRTKKRVKRKHSAKRTCRARR